MAWRDQGFTDNPICVGQPNVCKNNHKSDTDLKSALIEYLESIEFDPELENFYPELREKEDCFDQQHFQDRNLSWPYAVQECDVCIGEKRRYPGRNESKYCCRSRPLLTTYNKTKEENESASVRIYDVMIGVDDCHSEFDNSQSKNDSSAFSSNNQIEPLTHISDLGFERNHQNRKSVMMRDKEGCEVNACAIRENSKGSSLTESAVGRHRIFQTTDRSSKKPSRSRIEINMVSVSKREAKPNRDLIKMAGCDLGSGNQQTHVSKDGMRGQGTGGNNHCDDGNWIGRDDNRITTECVHRSSLSNLRKCDRKEMPVGAGVKNEISIDRQTKGNIRGFTWCARQSEINSAKPIKQLRQADDDTDVSPVMSIVCEGEGDESMNYEGERVNELRCDAKSLPQTRLSALSGLKPQDNRFTFNDSQDIHYSEDCLYSTNLETTCDTAITKGGDSRPVRTSEKGIGTIDSSRMNMLRDSRKITNSTTTKHQLIGNAVIKPTKSQFVNENGFDNDDKERIGVRTKPGSETQPEPIVIPIHGNEKEDGNVFEGKNKWMIEIVDSDNSSDNISFIPKLDTTRLRLSDEANCCEESFEKTGDPAADKKRKTIECLGDHNPVLENTSHARKSIEKGLSQKCIVYGDLEEKVDETLSNGKMWRKNAVGRDTVKQPLTFGEKSRFIYQGQGVQLRVNVKKPAESISNAPKDEQVGAGEKGSQPNKIISTGKAVSLKSTFKSVKTEGKVEIESRSIGKHTAGDDYHEISRNDEINLDHLDSDLVDILNYEPPKLSVPIIGKGHVEFGLNHPSEDSSLKMENARLSKLLLEVEQARSTTVKALLSANSVLHKVSDANTELEGALKTLNTDKKFLQLELEECKEKLKNANNEKDIFSAADATEFESSMKVIISSWKKEKQELLSALAKSSLRVKRVEADADGLRVAFQRVKDQLESSNATFTKLLEHNLQASVKIEEEMRGLKEEKEMLTERIALTSGDHEKIKGLEDEINELKSCLESLNDEKEELYKKIGHLEKKNKQLNVECDDLQEQLDHSQEIVDKLAETEESLKQRLEKETSEKEYLQDCLEETGQILFHLRNNEKKLLDEKGELEEDLEEEMQVNESLQQSLKSTMKEHQELVSRCVNTFYFYEGVLI